MLSHDSPFFASRIFAALHLPPLSVDSAGPLAHAVLARASLSIPDTLFLFVVALVVFGPKRLPEIGKQIGKLVFEFRRASNDFKLQIEEELRLSDQQERQKQIEMQAAAAQPVTPVAISADTAVSAVSSDAGGGVSSEASTYPEPPDRSPIKDATPGSELTIHPPASGLPVAALPPNHNAVMMPIPPAQAPPLAEDTLGEEAAAFEPQHTAHNNISQNHG